MCVHIYIYICVCICNNNNNNNHNKNAAKKWKNKLEFHGSFLDKNPKIKKTKEIERI